MSQDNPIVIPVPFHGDTITAVETPDGVMVAVKPICERLGLDWKSQHRRLKEDEMRWRGGHMTIPSAGGAQETYCIPLTRLAAWLFSINANKVRDDLREGLIRYQDEAADVLDRHFRLRHADQSEVIAILCDQLAACHMELVKANPRMAQIHYLWEPGEDERWQTKPRGLGMAQWIDITNRMQNCGMLSVAAAPDTRPQTMAERLRELQRELNIAKAELAKAPRRDAIPPEPVPSDLEADLQRRADKVGTDDSDA